MLNRRINKQNVEHIQYIPSFVFQDNFLKETWTNENSSILEAYQPVFLIALRSYREYKTYSSFVKEVYNKLKEKHPSNSFLSPQEEVIINIIV